LQLHLSITGSTGGFVELQFSRENGSLLQVTVIDRPPTPVDQTWLKVPLSGESITPVVDTSQWAFSSFEAGPEIDVVELEERLGFDRVGDIVKLVIGDRPAGQFMSCQDVAVGISDIGTIAEIRARVVEVSHNWP
jgi:hypothetical protein